LRAMAAAAAEGGVNGAAEGRGRRGFMPAGRGFGRRSQRRRLVLSPRRDTGHGESWALGCARIYLVGPTGLVPIFLLQLTWFDDSKKKSKDGSITF
jgi:hypothetical protein